MLSAIGTRGTVTMMGGGEQTFAPASGLSLASDWGMAPSIKATVVNLSFRPFYNQALYRRTRVRAPIARPRTSKEALRCRSGLNVLGNHSDQRSDNVFMQFATS